MFPEAQVTHCAHSYSDHTPILLHTGGMRQVRLGERPLRFQAAWLTHNKFKEFVSVNWPNEGGRSERLD